jgi:hypothetical protein
VLEDVAMRWVVVGEEKRLVDEAMDDATMLIGSYRKKNHERA